MIKMKNKEIYLNSWVTALTLYPLIAIVGTICQIYSYDRFDSFFMAGFIIHGYLVTTHPWAKYSQKTIFLTYIAGIIGAVIGYLNESNSIVISLMAIMSVLHFTSKPTEAFIEFEKLDEKEQKKIHNIRWIKSLVIGIVAFIIGVNIMSTIKTMISNDIIKTKFEKCDKTEFKNFKDSDAIAIAKCYDENKQLQFIRYYSTTGRTDDVYYFKDGKLEVIYDYNVGNKIHYLQYKIDNITKTKELNIYRGIRTYFKYGYKDKIEEKCEVRIDYIEDKITLYSQDGLQIYFDKHGNMDTNVASVYKDDKLVGSKKLTKEDLQRIVK